MPVEFDMDFDEADQTFSPDFGEVIREGGTANHDELANRGLPNQHPIEAITDLQDALDGKQSVGDYALAEDVPTELADLTDDTTHRTVTDTEKTTWNNKSDFSGDFDDLTHKPDMALYALIANLASVAFTGAYADVSGTPDLSIYAVLANLATVASSGAYADLSGLPDLSVYALISSLATVATSGSYTDLSNKPTIPTVPTNVSAFNNDSGYLTLATLPVYTGSVTNWDMYDGTVISGGTS